MKPLAVFFFIVACLLAMLFTLTGAHATPLTGNFTVVGNFMPFPGPPCPGCGVSLTTATAIDFTPCVGLACIPSGQNPTPGVAGEFLVTTASGAFGTLGLAGQVGSIRDFSFVGPGSLSFPSAGITNFETVGALTFDLASLSVLSQTAAALSLAGAGIFNAAGFDPTFGTWSFLGQQKCAAGFCTGGAETFVFNAGSVIAVPEPSILLLMGVGLIGIAAVVRRRS